MKPPANPPQKIDGPPASTAEMAPRAWIEESAPLWIEATGSGHSTLRRPMWKWIGLVLIVLGAVFLNRLQNHTARPTIVGPIEAPEGVPSPSVAGVVTAVPRIVVHVVGKVKRPGVYEFPPNSRVRDAVAKAGGAAPGADVNAINLAAWLEDGKQIEVPSKTNSPAISSSAIAPRRAETIDREEIIRRADVPHQAQRPDRSSTPSGKTRNDSTARPSTLIGSARVIKTDDLHIHPLDLNRASGEELELLPGIGPAIAARILQYRSENGDFSSVDELDNVKGIGEKKLAKLRPLVFVR